MAAPVGGPPPLNPQEEAQLQQARQGAQSQLPQLASQYIRTPGFQALTPPDQVLALTSFMGQQDPRFKGLRPVEQSQVAQQVLTHLSPTLGEKVGNAAEAAGTMALDLIPGVAGYREGARRFEEGQPLRGITQRVADLVGYQPKTATSAGMLEAFRDMAEFAGITAATAGMGGLLGGAAERLVGGEAFQLAKAGLARSGGVVGATTQAVEQVGREAAGRLISEHVMRHGVLEPLTMGAMFGASRALDREVAGEPRNLVEDFVGTPVGFMGLALGFMGLGGIARRFGQAAATRALQERASQFGLDAVEQIDSQAGRVVEAVRRGAGLKRDDAADLAFRVTTGNASSQEVDTVLRALRREPQALKSDVGLHILKKYRDRALNPKISVAPTVALGEGERPSTVRMKFDTVEPMDVKGPDGNITHFGANETVEREFSLAELKALKEHIQRGSILVDEVYGPNAMLDELGYGPGYQTKLNQFGVPNEVGPGKPVAREMVGPGRPGQPLPGKNTSAGFQRDLFPEQYSMFDKGGPWQEMPQQMVREMSTPDVALEMEKYVSGLPLGPELRGRFSMNPDYLQAVSDVNADLEQEAYMRVLEQFQRDGRTYKTQKGLDAAVMREVGNSAEYLGLSDADFDRLVLEKMGLTVSPEGRLMGPLEVRDFEGTRTVLEDVAGGHEGRMAPSTTETQLGMDPVQVSFEDYLAGAPKRMRELAKKQRRRERGADLETLRAAEAYRAGITAADEETLRLAQAHQVAREEGVNQETLRLAQEYRDEKAAELTTLEWAQNFRDAQRGKPGKFQAKEIPADELPLLQGRVVQQRFQVGGNVPFEPLTESIAKTEQKLAKRLARQAERRPRYEIGQDIKIEGVTTPGVVSDVFEYHPLHEVEVTWGPPGEEIRFRGTPNPRTGEMMVPDRIKRIMRPAERPGSETAPTSGAAEPVLVMLYGEEGLPKRLQDRYPGYKSPKQRAAEAAKGPRRVFEESGQGERIRGEGKVGVPPHRAQASFVFVEDPRRGELFEFDLPPPPRDRLSKAAREAGGRLTGPRRPEGGRAGRVGPGAVSMGDAPPTMVMAVENETKDWLVMRSLATGRTETIARADLEEAVRAGTGRWLTATTDKFGFDKMPIDKITPGEIMVMADKHLELAKAARKSKLPGWRMEERKNLKKAQVLEYVTRMRMRHLDKEFDTDVASSVKVLNELTKSEKYALGILEREKTVPPEERTVTSSSLGVKGCAPGTRLVKLPFAYFGKIGG